MTTSAQRDEYRFTPDDEAAMLAEAARLGDRDALDAIRVGMDPERRSFGDVFARSWWTRGLVRADLRDSEYQWSVSHIGDAYSQAFQATVDDEAGS